MKKGYKFIIYFLTIFCSLIILETGSWFCLKFYEYIVTKRITSPLYQEIDPADPTNYILTPNSNITFRQLKEERERSEGFANKIGKEWLNRYIDTYNFALDQTAVYTNSYGFRGPEITKDKNGKIRIMCIGDSVTFGLYGPFQYPRTLEEELIKHSYNAEVINAGIEGYSVKNVAKRVGYLNSFNPDMITLLIGWNTIYRDWDGLYISFLDKIIKGSNFLRLLRLLTAKIITLIRYKGEVPPYALYGPLEGKIYKKVNIKYKPSFLNDISRAVDNLRRNNPKVKIALFTLPSLLDPYEVPDKGTLQISNLNPYINNAYVVAYIAYAYNESIRQLAKEKDCFLIDLEKYTDLQLIPKKNYFFDTCHLRPAGQVLIGKYIADVFIREKILTQ